MTILNHDYIKNSITRNQGKEEVAYRWSHGATDMHLGDGLLIYSLIQFHTPVPNGSVILAFYNSTTV